jgi:hypothetical protein
MNFTRRFLLAACMMLPSATVFAQAAATTNHFEGPFEVVILRRGNPIHEPFGLIGKLAIDVDSINGTFTGNITAGLDQNGAALPAVRFDGPTLTPSPTAPGSYNVYGQITGRSMSIAIELDADNNQFIYGTGVMKQDPRDVVSGKIDFVRNAGGPAVGPEGGDQGDWAALYSNSTTVYKDNTTTQTCQTIQVLGYTVYQNCTTTTNNKN